MNKNKLRQEMRQRRRDHPIAQQCSDSHAMSEHLLASPEYQSAHHIAGYSAIQGEIHCQRILDFAIQEEKTCYLPALKDDRLQFRPYHPQVTMTLNTFGIPEPDTHDASALETLDLILLPLVCFDANGHRLGMGKGYYDKTLAKLKDSPPPYLVGLAFDYQRVDAFQTDPWDIALTAVCTETGFYRF